MEGELVPGNCKPVLPADGLIQICIQGDPGQIYDSSAAFANKVAVGGGDCVEPFLSLDHAHALNQAVVLEENQVPVHRPQTEIGVGRLKLMVDPLGRGVTVCGLNQ